MFNITIVGSGNSGCAHAAYLSSLGHKVTLLKTSRSIHDDNFDTICRQKGLYYIDSHEENKATPVFQPIHMATRNCEEAFQEADVVFLLTQSLQHENVAQLITPYLKNIKLLVIVPGNLGSVFFRDKLPRTVMISRVNQR